MPRRLFLVAVVCLPLVVVASLLWISGFGGNVVDKDAASFDSSSAVQSAGHAVQPSGDAVVLEESDYRRAKQMFRNLYPGAIPTAEDVFSVAGELAVSEGRFDVAVRAFAEIPTEHPKYGLSARLQQGTSLLELNRASEAEECLKSYLKYARLAPQVSVEDVVYAFKWLNYILSVTLRLEERQKYLNEVHQLGLADLLDSKQFLFPSLLILNSPSGRLRAEQFAATEPSNISAQIAVARYLTMSGEFENALTRLQSVKQVAGEIDAMNARQLDAAILEVFYDSGMVEEFESAVAQLPQYSVDEPWLLTRYRGEYAVQQKKFDEAVRHFSLVLDADPSDAPAQMGLAAAFKGLGQDGDQENALKRSSVLAKIRSHLPAVQQDSIEPLRELVSLCESIGYEEAIVIFNAHIDTIKKLGQAAG